MPLADRSRRYVALGHPDFQLVLRSSHAASNKSFLPNADLITLGSASGCHCQLDGSGLKPWHATIQFGPTHCWIETADADALVRVDGVATQRAILLTGDCFEIGDWTIELVAGRETSLSKADPLPRLQPSPGEDLSTLSVDELCDRITAEQADIAAFESTRRDGWMQLEHAVAQQQQAIEAGNADLSHLISRVRELTVRLQFEVANGQDSSVEGETAVAESWRAIA